MKEVVVAIINRLRLGQLNLLGTISTNMPKNYARILFFDSEITKYFDCVKILVSPRQTSFTT